MSLLKIGVQITVVEVRKADFEVVVVSNPTNWSMYPNPIVNPIIIACFRKKSSFASLGEKRMRIPRLECLEIARNIPSESAKRIAAKRTGEISPKAFLTIENVVPQTAVRMVRMMIARVFLLSGGTCNIIFHVIMR